MLRQLVGLCIVFAVSWSNHGSGQSVMTQGQFYLDETPLSTEIKRRHSYAEAISKAGPAVVRIISRRGAELDALSIGRGVIDPNNDLNAGDTVRPNLPSPTRGEGSGVLVSTDGYILTNYHVVERTDWISIILPRADKEYEARLVGMDSRSDLALLKIEGQNFPAITIGNSNHLEVGDVVLAIGNPFGIGQTSTLGIVSALGRSDLPMARAVDLANFIQTDAAINPGNSGGALIDVKGRLIGINSALLNPDGYASLGVGFAIPINQARAVMDQLILHGEVRRGYLGMTIQKVTPALADFFGMMEAKGALVTNVYESTPAADAGIIEEDIITSIDGTQILSGSDFKSRIAQVKPGETIQLGVLRRGSHFTTYATLKEQADLTRYFLGDAASANLKPANTWFGDLLEGVSISSLDLVWRRQLNAPDKVPCGAVAVHVDSRSPFAKAGIASGSIILRIDKQDICTSSDAYNYIAGQRKRQYLLRTWYQGRFQYITVTTNN
ncbi:MAG: trypsin-like peptidase domain-containing protein [Verrucomicrobia bacterium]|nr:trypsin-like peptidase domain-containing protein [Verrucomicrobiota bacterium]